MYDSKLRCARATSGVSPGPPLDDATVIVHLFAFSSEDLGFCNTSGLFDSDVIFSKELHQAKTSLWECLKTIKEAQKSELETCPCHVLKEMFVMFVIVTVSQNSKYWQLLKVMLHSSHQFITNKSKPVSSFRQQSCNCNLQYNCSFPLAAVSELAKKYRQNMYIAAHYAYLTLIVTFNDRDRLLKLGLG